MVPDHGSEPQSSLTFLLETTTQTGLQPEPSRVKVQQRPLLDSSRFYRLVLVLSGGDVNDDQNSAAGNIKARNDERS